MTKTIYAISKKSVAAGLALLLSAPAGAVGPALSQIGVAGAVRGKVMAFPPAAQAKSVGREVASGKPLFLNEKVTTDPKGHMQIMLKDETTFTLGPNASMVLDEFVYDPATGAGEVTASVTKGAFRFVTGRISAKDPSKMKVKFPTGTIGIRGTIVAGMVNEDGSTTVVLLGPGSNNNAGERSGAFDLGNDGGSVEVTQPGFGSTMSSEETPPTPPALVPPEQMGAIMGALAPPEEQSSGSGEGGGGETAAGGDAAMGGDDGMGGMDMGGAGAGDVSSLAGQDTMVAADMASDFGSVAGITDVTNAVTNTASNDSADNTVVEQNSSAAIVDGTSTWDDVRTVASGVGYYGGAGVFTLTQCQSAACADPAGFFAYLLKIDFSNQTFAAGSYVWAEDDVTQTTVEDYVMIEETSYAALSGDAAGQAVSDGGEFTADFTLKNIGGAAAAGVDVSAAYASSGGDTYGSGTASFPLAGSMADSTWDAVKAVPSGVGVYAGAGHFRLTQCQGAPCVDPDGVFAYLLRIDFGAQRYGGGESGVAFMAEDIGTSTNISGSFGVGETDYSAESGVPLIQATYGAGFDIDFTLKDVDGTVGAGLDAAVTYTGGDGTLGDGLSSAVLTPSNGFISQWSSLQAITSGAGFFKGSGAFNLTDCNGPCVDPTGSFDYLVYVDFAGQTFGGNGSVASFHASDPGSGVNVADSMEIWQEPYAGRSGDAELGGYNYWWFYSESWNFGIDFTLKDVQGIPAGGLTAYAYYNYGGNIGEGRSNALREAVSDWAGVDAVPSGTAWFTGSGPFYLDYCNDYCSAPTGGFRYALLVDFGNNSYGGPGSGAWVWAEDLETWVSVHDSVAIPETTPFPANGSAFITGTSDSGYLTVDFTLKDLAGTSAMGVGASVSYYDDLDYVIGYGGAASGRSSPPADGASTWGDLLTLEGGMARFGGLGAFTLTQCGGGACSAPQGFFAYLALIDFGARTYSGSAYLDAEAEPETTVWGHINIPETSFDGAAGFTGTSGAFTVDFTLKNAGGFAAAGLDAVATYSDLGAGTVGSGSASGPMAGLSSSIWDGVEAIPYGVGLFKGGGAFGLNLCNFNPCTDPKGYFEYLVKVDFANNIFGGMGSGAVIQAGDPGNQFVDPVSISETINIGNTFFSGWTGSGVANMFDTYSSNSGNAWINFTLRDVGGFSAMGLDALAYYNDGSTMGRGWSHAPRLEVSDFADVNALQPAGGAGFFRGSGDFFLSTCNGGACADPLGGFEYAVYIDFGAQELGGNGSTGWLYASATDAGLNPVAVTDSLLIPAQGYIGYLDGDGFFASSLSGNLTMNFSLRDVGGLAAMGLDASAFYFDGLNAGAGLSFAPRQAVSLWDGPSGIQSIQSGTGWYEGAGGFRLVQCALNNCSNTGPFDTGYMRYGLLINFEGPSIGGGGSGVFVTAYEDVYATQIAETVHIPETLYDVLSGPAHFSVTSPNNNLKVDFSLKDVDTLAALGAEVTAVFDDQAGTVGYGYLAGGRVAVPGLSTLNGTATWDDVRAIQGGTGQYATGSQPFTLASCEGAPCAGPGPHGTFDVTLDVDFGARTYRLQSNVSATDPNLSAGNYPSPVNTAQDVLDEVGDFLLVTGDATMSHWNAGYLIADFTLKNSGGAAAAAADLAAAYNDAFGTSGSGAVTDVSLSMAEGTVDTGGAQ
ncbi:MAG: FecR domain-containing protein [Elusimicrobia bacterium]|nr:FecR domain-containing protein [Elusimicrobiota bacterium]